MRLRPRQKVRRRPTQRSWCPVLQSEALAQVEPRMPQVSAAQQSPLARLGFARSEAKRRVSFLARHLRSSCAIFSDRLTRRSLLRGDAPEQIAAPILAAELHPTYLLQLRLRFPAGCRSLLPSSGSLTSVRRLACEQ